MPTPQRRASIARAGAGVRPRSCSGCVAFAALLPAAGKHLILNEIAILALFALSLDLILGYAGIVSLGHAAFFGLGAYAAGLLAKHVTRRAAGRASPSPRRSPRLLGFVTSFLVLRGTDLTRLMVTLGVALVLRRGRQPGGLASTGGADGLQGVVDGPAARPVRVRPLRPHRLRLQPRRRCSCCSCSRAAIVHSPFGLSLRRSATIRCAPRRSACRSTGAWSRSTRSPAAYAGVAGALLAQTTQFVSLDVLAFHRSADVLLVLVIGGAGCLYGGLIGAVVFMIAAGRAVAT